MKVVCFICSKAPHYTKASQICTLTAETVTESKQDKIFSNSVRKHFTKICVTYTIGLLEDGAWVITVLDVGDGIACWIITLESELVSSTLGTCSDAGRTIVDVGCAVCCSDTSWGKTKINQFVKYNYRPLIPTVKWTQFDGTNQNFYNIMQVESVIQLKT